MSLADPYLKTSWAKEHLDALRKELEFFCETKPCKLRAQDDPKRGICRFITEIKETPDKIPLLAGDIFYNLRSALDQLVWCLAKLHLPYPENTQFPILEARNQPLFERRTKGVSADALAIIESLQPYQGRDAVAAKSHLLWRLDKMCNIDKHMRIPVYASVLDFMLPKSVVGEARFEDGGIMCIPLASKPVLKSYMELNPAISIKIVFGDSYWGMECDVDGIETIYNFVTNNVIPRFARFFK